MLLCAWVIFRHACNKEAEGMAHLKLQSCVIQCDDFGEDAGPQCSLVFLKKCFVYILVKERGLSHTEEKRFHICVNTYL